MGPWRMLALCPGWSCLIQFASHEKALPPLRSVLKTTERRRGLSHLSLYSNRGIRIHFASQRDGPLIRVECARTPPERSAGFSLRRSMLGAMIKDHAKSAKEARDYTDGAGLSSARRFRELEEMKRISREASNVLKEGQKRQRRREPRKTA